jgi:hypothetical protein
MKSTEQEPRFRLSLMDWMAIVAGVINTLVICYIVISWFQQ